MPPGVILPPAARRRRPSPSRRAGLGERRRSQFDASAAAPRQRPQSAASIVSYAWNFGDGGTGDRTGRDAHVRAVGSLQRHADGHQRPRLVGVDDQTVTVGASVAPTADFVFSPTPAWSASVSLQRGASTAAPATRSSATAGTSATATIGAAASVQHARLPTAGTYHRRADRHRRRRSERARATDVTVGTVIRRRRSRLAVPTVAPDDVTFDGSASTASAARRSRPTLDLRRRRRRRPTVRPRRIRTRLQATYTVTLTVTDSLGAGTAHERHVQ